MKIYRVLTRAPAWSGCGSIQANNITFRSKTIANNFAKKETKKLRGQEHLIVVEEFILKDLIMDNLLMAFDNEDIMDLIESRNTVNTYRFECKAP